MSLLLVFGLENPCFSKKNGMLCFCRNRISRVSRPGRRPTAKRRDSGSLLPARFWLSLLLLWEGAASSQLSIAGALRGGPAGMGSL